MTRKINKDLCFSDGGKMVAPEPIVSRALKWTFGFLAVFAVLLVVAIVLWVTNPTRVYYKPVTSYVYQTEDGQWMANVTRELPRGSFRGRWGLTVWVQRGEASFVCGEPMGHIIDYRSDQGPTVEYELPPTVSRCMNEAPPINLTWTRQAVLFGWIPLKPMTTTITIDPEVKASDEDA